LVSVLKLVYLEKVGKPAQNSRKAACCTQIPAFYICELHQKANPANLPKIQIAIQDRESATPVLSAHFSTPQSE